LICRLFFDLALFTPHLSLLVS